MKKTVSTTKELAPTLKTALMRKNPLLPSDNRRRIKNYWKEAQSVEEFYNMILNDQELIYNKGYAIISKKDRKHHFYRLREHLDPFLKFKVSTPKGFLKISINDAISFVPNGFNHNNYPLTRVGILELNESLNPYMFGNYFVVKGTIKIYDKNEVIAEVCGKYQILNAFGFIIFNHIGNSFRSEYE